MEENKRGGKRMGAGRKPLADKKKTVSLYVEEKKIWHFGSEQKLKDRLYDFIDGNTIEQPPENIINDLTKPTNNIKPHEQPKTNFSIDTTPKPSEPLMTRFEAYRGRILKTTMMREIVPLMREIKNDILSYKEKQSLETIAKEHSKDFFND